MSLPGAGRELAARCDVPRIGRVAARMRWAAALAMCGWLGAVGLPAAAGEVDVVDAQVRCTPQRICVFRATLRHADEGWQHYADRWEVLTPEGRVLATRVLRHPHVAEQPFTRALPEVEVPRELESVVIRAHDLVHAHGGAEYTLRLPEAPPLAPNP